MSDTRDASTDQPIPTADPRSREVAASLKALIDSRTALGIRKYGRPLNTFNGRDATRDALEESVDLNQYLMQDLMEARAEIKRLQAIINELPLTADGVPVVPGQKVWPLNSEGLANPMPVELVVWSDEDHDFWEIGTGWNRYYASREKADAAMAKEKR